MTDENSSGPKHWVFTINLAHNAFQKHTSNHRTEALLLFYCQWQLKKVDSPSWSTHFPPTIHREPAHSRKWQTSQNQTCLHFSKIKMSRSCMILRTDTCITLTNTQTKVNCYKYTRTNLLEACWSFSSEWSSCRSPPARPFDSAVDLTHSQHKLSANRSKHHVSLSSVFTDHHRMKEWADTRSEAMFL